MHDEREREGHNEAWFIPGAGSLFVQCSLITTPLSSKTTHQFSDSRSQL